MKWDAFISYATEDQSFVRDLANALQRAGLRIWFDQFELKAGDSLFDSVDQGLREAGYGIVVLSKNFFNKKWTKRELAALATREGQGGKVIIPIWYQIDAQDVRTFSPILADKISIVWKSSTQDVVNQLLRAIVLDEDPQFKSGLVEILPCGLEVVMLPIGPLNGIALGIGRHPITNQEYRSFVESTGYAEPSGQEFRKGSWRGPFDPWKNELFSSPELPVVCVSFWDAWLYSLWRSGPGTRCFIPNVELWELAAVSCQLGRQFPPIVIPQWAHHKAKVPLPVDRNGSRTNTLGISDLIGNVWEWCCGNDIHENDLGNIAAREFVASPELRGGSFLDDLVAIELAVSAVRLADRDYTKHTDLGFRIAVAVPAENLSSERRSILENQPPLTDLFWKHLPDPIRYASAIPDTNPRVTQVIRGFFEASEADELSNRIRPHHPY